MSDDRNVPDASRAKATGKEKPIVARPLGPKDSPTAGHASQEPAPPPSSAGAIVRSKLPIILVGGGAALLMIVGGLLWAVVFSSPQEPVAQRPGTEQPEAEPPPTPTPKPPEQPPEQPPAEPDALHKGQDGQRHNQQAGQGQVQRGQDDDAHACASRRRPSSR